MGLIERLRKAEQQGKQAAREAYERAKELGEDAERRIRQKMRIYPPSTANHTESKRTIPTGATAAPRRSPVTHLEPVEPESEPIVSIHGEDVDENEKVA